ncbi:MAG TPA: heparan-alpha-glucosaminide N-acetyltransferase domain-containing protein [Candidatus Sulfotelmatobacter sp.]|nr:heparan-alpha-glucosaminide N-acetyltransferase domain-containing protein [Candidatus Sulfotelmatobacter sp.]
MARLQSSPPLVTAPASTASRRLMSVDALRGFDMFWIIGADSLVYALHRLTQSRPTSFLADQLEHAEWHGFHFYDLIFPLFVFIVGVSLVFSLTKTIEGAGRGEALKRVFRRGILLFAIGILYSGGFATGWPDMRLLGVLNRIALAYFFAGLLFCFFKPRALAAICVSLLVGYWALMTFLPIRDIQLEKGNLARLAEQAGDTQAAALLQESTNPSAVKHSPAWAAAERLFAGTTNHVSGRFSPGLNLANHLDFQYLPGRRYDAFYDPEGLLSTIPAVATCLLGVFAGLLLRNPSVPDKRKVVYLLAFGAGSVAAGWLWSMQFPLNKKLWTSSFVLVAGGYSALLLGVFYLIVDIWQARAWCQPFVWMGMNSITIYLTSNVIGGFRKLATRFVGGDVKVFFDDHLAKGMGDMMISIVGLLLAFWFVHFLYRRKVFLRL